jgi:hypothetical protein
MRISSATISGQKSDGTTETSENEPEEENANFTFA